MQASTDVRNAGSSRCPLAAVRRGFGPGFVHGARWALPCSCSRRPDCRVAPASSLLGPPRRAAPHRHGECELDPTLCLSISSATVLRESQRRNTSGAAATSTMPFWRSGEAAANCSNSARWREASSVSIRRICARADRAKCAARSTDIARIPCCAKGAPGVPVPGLRARASTTKAIYEKTLAAEYSRFCGNATLPGPADAELPQIGIARAKAGVGRGFSGLAGACAPGAGGRQGRFWRCSATLLIPAMSSPIAGARSFAPTAVSTRRRSSGSCSDAGALRGRPGEQAARNISPPRGARQGGGTPQGKLNGVKASEGTGRRSLTAS